MTRNQEMKASQIMQSHHDNTFSDKTEWIPKIGAPQKMASVPGMLLWTDWKWTIPEFDGPGHQHGCRPRA